MKNVQAGDWVTYEDMANPPKTYEVVGLYETRFATEWVLVQIDTNEEKYSDLRQAGWKAYRSYVRG